ncbi:cell division topological specificity factor MinE [Buchnera aphidicola]|uniref:cell division topological specificity factor MinE n=1 Tax=Buchnera aphidicola TaxID=9 RepID=UPI0031B6983F
MTILDFFIPRKNNTAHIAKERLKIMIAEQKSNAYFSDCLPEIKKEILKVMCKYIKIKPKMLQIKINSKDRNTSVLKLSIFFFK